MKKKILYEDKKLGRLEIVKDFLPKPQDLVMKEPTVKVTLNLHQSSIKFFKAEAKKQGAQYQKLIRALLDHYAAHYSK